MGDFTVPRRIFELMPEVKLIAVLRNSIDRALSHYKMFVRRGKERRSFESAVKELLSEEMLGHARALLADTTTEHHCYVSRGEYGRILQDFLSVFPCEQLPALFTEDMEEHPDEVIDQVLGFLGLDPGFRPPNIGIKYHRGGTRRRVPSLDRLMNTGGSLRELRQFLLPATLRRRVSC